jgi:UDP-glucose 4-epimerase
MTGTEAGDRPRVMVIGGAGFIGSHLVDRLLVEDRAVDVVDDLSTGALHNLAAARQAGGELTIHTLDASGDDLAALIALRRPAQLYHLAVLPPGPASVIELGRSFTSVLSTLDAARRSAVSKVVLALPATALYGHPAARDLPVKEGALAPRGVRGVVAHAILELLGVYRERWEIEFTALAVATVYGPRQRPDGGVVAALADAATRRRAPAISGDGRQTRDFVYVDDVVDALVRAGQRGSGLLVNVGTGVQTSIRDVWAKLAAGGDGPAPALVAARRDELSRFAVSPVRARIHLAWSPWTTIDDGLAQLR